MTNFQTNIYENTNLGTYLLRLFEITRVFAGYTLGHRECLSKYWLLKLYLP
jgi:hypothetical protein